MDPGRIPFEGSDQDKMIVNSYIHDMVKQISGELIQEFGLEVKNVKESFNKEIKGVREEQATNIILADAKVNI